MTKQVERLVENGLVKRVLPRGANRRRVIALTPKGVRAADFAQESISNSLAGIAPTLKTLRPGEVQTTLKCLESLLTVAVAHGSTTEAATGA